MHAVVLPDDHVQPLGRVSLILSPLTKAVVNGCIVTVSEITAWSGLGPARITIRKHNGEVRVWDSYGGLRVIGENERLYLSDEELAGKFNRVCAYQKVDDAQRDRARAIWGNLRQVKDIADAIQTLSKFGKPKPLNA